MKHLVNFTGEVEAFFLVPEYPDERFKRLLDGRDSVYFLSSYGRLYSMLSQKYIKGAKRKIYNQHYHQYMLSDCRFRPTHQLVMAAFGEPKPSDAHEIDHIDGNGLNNYINNLQWVTHSENIKLTYERGRKIFTGEEHWLYGKSPSAETRRKMGEKKAGENHPKFKGWYVVNGQRYASSIEAAKDLGTYPKKIYLACKQGKNGCKFEPK